MKAIDEYLSDEDILLQWAEEAGELLQAICNRILVEYETGVRTKDVMARDEYYIRDAEMCGAIAKSSCKLVRAYRGVNPTPMSVEECRDRYSETVAEGYYPRSNDISECDANLIEEFADVFLCAYVYSHGDADGKFFDEVLKVSEEKHDRWIKRLKEKEAAEHEENR